MAEIKCQRKGSEQMKYNLIKFNSMPFECAALSLHRHHAWLLLLWQMDGQRGELKKPQKRTHTSIMESLAKAKFPTIRLLLICSAAIGKPHCLQLHWGVKQNKTEDRIYGPNSVNCTPLQKANNRGGGERGVAGQKPVRKYWPNRMHFNAAHE